MAIPRFFLSSFFLSLSCSISSEFSHNEECPAQTAAYEKSIHRLSKPLIGDDRRIYACSGNNLFSFETNGSIAWSVHLNFKCDLGFAPVHSGSGNIFIVAENRILRVESQQNRSEPEVFFDPGETIIGFAASPLSSLVFITVKNRGLYACNMLRQQIWIAEPKFEHFGYRLGCRKNIEGCSFNSPPVIDACEACIYISNTKGELYSLSLRAPRFNWIQDFSSVDQFFTVTPGNNGLLYVIFPVKSLVFALHTFSGDILWQKNVGPLPDSGCDPVVDSNGWISIGSLDGSLYSFSPTGSLQKFPKHMTTGSVIQVDPFLDCSGRSVYVSQIEMEGKIDHVIGQYTYVTATKPKAAIFTLVVPETGSVLWSESFPDQISVLLSSKDMKHFVLDERIVLAFIAASETGNPLQCRSKHKRLKSSCSLAQPEQLNVYIGNERAIIWFLLTETVFLILLIGLVQFCWVFWKKKKLQGQSLGNFLEKRQKKKEFYRTITELQKEAADNEAIEKISDLIGERENVERKLSSTYSLRGGRDREISNSKSKTNSSILPLYDKDSRNLSFRSTETESITIFRGLSDQSSTGGSSGSSLDDDDDTISVDADREKGDLTGKLKGESLIDSAGSDDDDDGNLSVPSSSRRNKCMKRRTFSSTN